MKNITESRIMAGAHDDITEANAHDNVLELSLVELNLVAGGVSLIHKL